MKDIAAGIKSRVKQNTVVATGEKLQRAGIGTGIIDIPDNIATDEVVISVNNDAISGRPCEPTFSNRVMVSGD